MKRAIGGFGAAILFCALSVAAAPARTFTGEITDSGCAAMGGHTAMLSKGETPKDCTLSCVKAGAKFVLFDATNKVVYELDDQKKPAAFAAARVKITGTLDADGKTIHLADIVAAK